MLTGWRVAVVKVGAEFNCIDYLRSERLSSYTPRTRVRRRRKRPHTGIEVIERSPGFRLVMLNKSGSPLLATQSDIEAIIAREVRGEFDRLTFGHQPVSFRVGDEVVVIEGLIEGTVGTVAAVGRSITVDVANLPRPVHLLAKRLALR